MNPAEPSTSELAAPASWSNGLRRKRFGQRLGRYVLGSLLGSGGAASVYLARLDGPQGFERLLALKVVHEHLLVDSDFVATFLDEATLASQLQHPNIVHCYELCQDRESLYLAMEYLQGEPLSRVYRRALERGQPLSYALIAWIGARAAEALAYAHGVLDSEGQPLRLVHRDVSPDNLFICYDGQLKLLDFGIARAARRRSQTNLGQIKGKLRYMAPEYALGHDFDGALDLFALGATLYEAALGRPAFEGDEQVLFARILRGEVRNPRELRPDFPEPLWRLLKAMLDPDPETRFGPAAAVARELSTLSALDFAQGRAFLALTMERLFGPEQARDSDELAELRALPRLSDEFTPQAQVLARPKKVAASGRLKFALLGAVSLALGALLFALHGRRALENPHAAAAPLESPTTRTAPAESVDIGVVVTPSGIPGVEIDIAGVGARGSEAHRTLPRGSLPLQVHVSAPGYRDAAVTVIPERDRSLVLALSPIAAAVVSSAPSVRKVTGRAPASESQVIRRYPF